MEHDINPDDINRLRNLALSREKVEDIRRIALSLEDGRSADDADLLFRAAEFCEVARRALKGGRLEVRGSRHWDSP